VSEFDELVESALEGTLDAAGLARLESLLAEDPGRRRDYLRRAHLAAMLIERGGEAAPRRARRPLAVPVLAAAALVVAWAGLAFLGGGREPARPAPVEFALEERALERVAPGPGRVLAGAVDISASMVSEGRELAPLVERLFDELEALEPRDRFSLLAVGRELHAFRSAPVVATPENLAAAREWLEGLSPEVAGRPGWPDRGWREWRGGRHFGADLLAAMERCFSYRPDRIVYATDWVMEPGSVRTEKQALIEATRRWQRGLEEPARLDVFVDRLDGHNRFLGDYAAEHGGRFVVVGG